MRKIGPLLVLALGGLGVAIAMAAKAESGFRFLNGCTGGEFVDQSKAQEVFEQFAVNASFASPQRALDGWIRHVGGNDAVQCFGLEILSPRPALAAFDVPDLPSRDVAAMYLLMWGRMIQAFSNQRPEFPAPGSDVFEAWKAVADEYSLTDAEVNAVDLRGESG